MAVQKSTKTIVGMIENMMGYTLLLSEDRATYVQFCHVLYIYVQSVSSLLIESTDSMIIIDCYYLQVHIFHPTIM